jgi:inosine-uridine nucleoside N-ribohydrolase
MTMSDKPIPMILDTDIGDDIDDAYALVLATRWPAVKLEAVTATYGPTLSRARLARKLLDLMGRHDVPVYAADDKHGSTPQLDWAADYAYTRPVETAPEFLARTAHERPGEVTLVTIGPLPNIGHALDLNPELGRRFKRFVMMAGWIHESYTPGKPDPEWNVVADIPAAKKVFTSGADIAMIGLDVTMKAQFGEAYQKRLAEAGKPWCDALLTLTKLWGHGVPTQHDPLALSMVAGDFCKMERMRLEVDDAGQTKQVPGEPNAEAALSVDANRFLDWYVETVSR